MAVPWQRFGSRKFDFELEAVKSFQLLYYLLPSNHYDNR